MKTKAEKLDFILRLVKEDCTVTISKETYEINGNLIAGFRFEARHFSGVDSSNALTLTRAMRNVKTIYEIGKGG